VPSQQRAGEGTRPFPFFVCFLDNQAMFYSHFENLLSWLGLHSTCYVGRTRHSGLNSQAPGFTWTARTFSLACAAIYSIADADHTHFFVFESRYPMTKGPARGTKTCGKLM
jgi:hypothetical protein